MRLETVRASCVACVKTNIRKRGNSNKLNIMIKHMGITDCGNEISSDSTPDRGRGTMMLIIVKRVMPGRSLGGLHNDILSTYNGISYHIGADHQVIRENSLLVPKTYLFISYIVCSTSRTRGKMRWIAIIGWNVQVRHHLYMVCLNTSTRRQTSCIAVGRNVSDITAIRSHVAVKNNKLQQQAVGVSTEYGFTASWAQTFSCIL